MDKLFSTTIYYNAVVAGEKFAAQTVVSSDDKEQYESAMSDLFTTFAAKVDEQGSELFVTFEPRVVAGNFGGTRAGSPTGAGPLPDAPSDIPNCPIHNIPTKEKQNRQTGQKFYSCSFRKADGTYCNWTPPRKD